MILSRTMRPSDYEELKPEVEHLNKTIALCGPVPYMHRVWEYALVFRAVNTVFGDKKGLEVADFGCSDGLSPATMLREGHNVALYEIWDTRYGDKFPDAKNKATIASSAGGSKFNFVNKGLGDLNDDDKG